MSKNIDFGNSSFWMDRFSRSTDSEYSPNADNLYELASKKRAIANFVSIVTSKNIPVTFNSSGDSYTDGKTVVISSKLNTSSEFDVAVGLSLHEGSHILLSDFTILNILHKLIRDNSNLMAKISQKNVIEYLTIAKDLLNWVEDRRIDNYIFSNSPGYREYYHKMYDKYFNDSVIDKALQSSDFCDETIDSYLMRIINLHSKFTRLDALKGLPKIYDLVDLNNIARLKTTQDAFEVAIQIFDVILDNIEDPKAQSQPNSEPKSKPSQGNKKSNDSDESNESNDSDKSDDSDDSNDSEKSDESNDSDDSDDSMDLAGSGDKKDEAQSKLSKSALNRAKSQLSKQRKFLNGDIQKKSITNSEAKSISVIEESGISINNVDGFADVYGNIKSIKCMVVTNMTKSLIDSIVFPLSSKIYDSTGTKSYVANAKYSTEVDNGIRMGIMLGKKLQIRTESRDTIYNRQKVGKLDKRMISSIGYGNEYVFHTKEVDAYGKTYLHLSIDASSSMSQNGKWNKTITNAVAIAKAVDMVSNLEIQISFRTTTKYQNIDVPYVVIAYDSTKDKFSKVKDLFRYLSPNGVTPESLCFDAILKKIVKPSNDTESHFVNISDGEPYFHSDAVLYEGMAAAKHINKAITQIQSMGINVISFFVGNTDSNKVFNASYGKTAKYIDILNINEISKTMNKLFLEKK